MEILSTADAARELRLSVRAVQDLINKGILPAQRVGRSWLILRKDLGKAKESKRPKRGRPKEQDG